MNLEQTAFAGAALAINACHGSSGLIEGHETLVPLSEVPKMLPLRPNGKRVHISACYRWAGRGVHGIKLEVIRIGGSTYTSREALARFAAALSAGTGNAHAPHVIAKTRQRQIDAATTRLRNLLK